MLDLAVRHSQELQREYLATVGDPFYNFYYPRIDQTYYIPLVDDNGSRLQYVSLDDNGVAGYIGCFIDHLTRTAHGIEAIRFRQSKEFQADIYRFLDMLFARFGTDKAVWDVVVGNPVERYFDTLAAFYGINIAGVFHKAVMLPNGQLYDRKYYEFFKEEFIKTYSLGSSAPYDFYGRCKE